MDTGRADDGQTNTVLFDLSVWPSSAVPIVDDGQTNSFFLTYLSGRRAS